MKFRKGRQGKPRNCSALLFEIDRVEPSNRRAQVRPNSSPALSPLGSAVSDLVLALVALDGSRRPRAVEPMSWKGHRLDSRPRESSLAELLRAESKLLRCPQVEQNARACAIFSRFLRRTRRSRTDWRMAQSDANCSPRQPVNRLTP
jgi:hypothetical protein